MERGSMQIRVAAALAAATGLVVVPAAAQAATKTVEMGPPPKTANVFHEKYGSDSSNFYPAKITVRRGDKVRFVPYGLHNAAFPKRRGKPGAALAPAGSVSGAVDAAGAPFWFNGQPAFGFRSDLVKHNFGKTATYDGTKAVNSGLPLGEKLKPFTVRFTKQGTHAYYCELHTGMKGQVTVKSAKASVPSAAADRKRVAKQLAKDVASAKRLLKTKAPTNTILLGSSTAGGVESFGIFPKQLTVPVGTTVEFRMKQTSREVHTATFGPGNPDKEPNSYLGQLAKSFETPVIDGRATYPSEPPGTPTVHTAALHGNGFWNSGVLDGAKATPLPASAQVRFGQPGSYAFYCLIHPFMTGTVIVQ